MYETHLPLHPRKCGKAFENTVPEFPKDSHVGNRLNLRHRTNMLKSSSTSCRLMTLHVLLQAQHSFRAWQQAVATMKCRCQLRGGSGSSRVYAQRMQHVMTHVGLSRPQQGQGRRMGTPDANTCNATRACATGIPAWLLMSRTRTYCIRDSILLYQSYYTSFL